MSQRSFNIVIPARYDSTRLPAKALCDIAGKTLIQRVYERACESDADQVLVAADDQRIIDCCHDFGAKVLLTSTEHPSGTDRLAEVAQREQWSDDQIVVNLQGDEPLMPAALINQVANNLALDSQAAIATFCKEFETLADFQNPNCVKVVFNQQQHALYFSRAPVPYDRDEESSHPAHHHLGLYAYRAGHLEKFAQSASTRLEQLEKLEQLRALELGEKIHVDVTDLDVGIGVDTEADLEQVRRLFQ